MFWLLLLLHITAAGAASALKSGAVVVVAFVRLLVIVVFVQFCQYLKRLFQYVILSKYHITHNMNLLYDTP